MRVSDKIFRGDPRENPGNYEFEADHEVLVLTSEEEETLSYVE